MIKPPIYLDTKTTDLNEKQVKKLNQMIRLYSNRFISKAQTKYKNKQLDNPIEGRAGRIISTTAFTFDGYTVISGQLSLSNMSKGNDYPLFSLAKEPKTINIQGSTTTDLSQAFSFLGYLYYRDGLVYIHTLIDIPMNTFPLFTITF